MGGQKEVNIPSPVDSSMFKGLSEFIETIAKHTLFKPSMRLFT